MKEQKEQLNDINEIRNYMDKVGFASKNTDWKSDNIINKQSQQVKRMYRNNNYLKCLSTNNKPNSLCSMMPTNSE